LREFVAELLDYLGYQVGLAADGQETIEAYVKAKRAGRPFDCILMDLTIPGGMGGKETIHRLREFDPQVRAIVSSGYSDDPVMSDFKKYGFSGVVAKPYDAEKLSRVLSEVLSRQN
ncbi:MAG: response regulator, partial [Deltaproteobacteria bacterium]|nr:response regulator [Deltaproteobacteria bacterium]